MRCLRLLPLAAYALVVEAGPLRYHGALNSHSNYPRFYNISAQEPKAPSKPEPLTKSPLPVSTESSDVFSSQTSMAVTSTDTAGASTSSVSEALGSLSEVSSSVSEGSSSVSEAPSSVLEAPSLSPSLHQLKPGNGEVGPAAPGSITQTSSAPSSSSISISSSVEASAVSDHLSSTQSVSPVTAGAEAGRSSERFQLNTLSQVPISTVTPQASLPTGESDARSSQVSFSSEAKLTVSSSMVTLSSLGTSTASAPIATIHRNYPTADDGNLAMAVGYNQLFKTLDEDSRCDPKDNSSFIACIDGQPANCEVDGRYTFRSCPQGQSCYAVPRPAGQSGVDIDCYVPSVAAARLAPSSSSVAAVATSTTASDPQPTSTVGQNPEAVEAIQAAANSPASDAPAPISASNPQTATPLSHETHTSRAADESVVVAGVSSKAPQATSSDAIFSQSAPSHQQHKFVSSEDSVPAASASIAQLNTGPLVLSFPSDLPSSTMHKVSPTQAIPQTTVDSSVQLVAHEKDTRPIQESIVQAGMSPSSVAQAGERVAANNAPATTSHPDGSSTTLTNAPGITIVPMGATAHDSSSSYVKTVYITVTTTIHDR